MRKRMIQMLCCTLLAVFVPLSAFAATFSMAGFDGESSRHNWETNGFFTRMEARTGVRFSFEQYTTYEEWLAAKQRMFSEGALPDVLFKAEFTTREQIQYAAEGKLIDLLPLLPDYAPNLWALLQENPSWLAAITLPDGKVVALPMLNTLTTQNAMWINREWLEKLGLETPTDLDSLMETLRAFRDGDPNQNGKQDEIPLAYLGAWDLKFLSHVVGLVANDYNVYLDDTGTVHFVPDDERYITLLTWLRDAYAEGLLDPNGFTTADTLRTETDESVAAKYGIFFGPSPMYLLPYATGEAYTALMPLIYEGKQVYRDLFGGVIGGTFAITTACQDPAEMLRWVDVLYTQEGAIQAMAGDAGTDYLLLSSGQWTYAGDMQTQSDYILYDLSLYDTGIMPWLFPTEFYERYQNDLIPRLNQELAALTAKASLPFPTVALTPEQEDYILPIQNELGLYVDESLARFVLGEWDVRDPDVLTAYREGLRERGLDDFLTFWQTLAQGLT